MRRPLPKVAYQALLAVIFRTQFQDLLFTEEIERQPAGDDERKALVFAALDISGTVFKEQRVADLVQASKLALGARVNVAVTVVEEIDIAFEQLVVGVGLGVDQIGHVKWRAADGDDVHAPVVVALGYFADLRGATDTDNPFGQSKEDAERRFFVHAAAHHLAVAMLKNVQRKGGAGKQNDVQREKRNTFGPHECHS